MTSLRRTLFALALVLAPATAHADAWDAAMARAGAAKEKALDAEDPTAWQGVLDLFIEADAIRETKESKYEIGFAAAKVKADDVAVEAYEQALALGLSGPPMEKAKEFLAANLSKMGRLDVRGPAGAQVYVTGRRRGALPLARPIVAFAGTAHVRLISNGKVMERDLDLPGGETRIVDFTAEFAPPPPPPPVPVKPAPVVPPPSPAPKQSDTLGWALVGTGAFVTISSGVLWVVAAHTVSSRRESLADVCLSRDKNDSDVCLTAANAQERDWAQEDANLIHTFKPLRIVGAVGVGVGVLTMAIGAWQLGGKSEKTASVTPSIGKDGATFTLRVQF
ncbi:MAG: hypothetical protein ACXWUG_18110 [Polyangiales bacterium]